MTIKDKNYIVLFTLDYSGSMNQKGKWNQVKESVKNFINHLKRLSGVSFVKAILFNQQIYKFQSVEDR